MIFTYRRKKRKLRRAHNALAVYDWLLADESRIWKRTTHEDMCRFNSDKLEALYVYHNKIRYWEDIRVHSAYKEFPIPKNAEELFRNINSYHKTSSRK